MIVPVLAGDDLGPLVTEVAVAALAQVAPDLRPVHLPYGRQAFTTHGHPVPEFVVEAIREAGVALLGAAETPLQGYASPTLALRRATDCDLLLRPCRHGATRAMVIGHSDTGLYGAPERTSDDTAEVTWRLTRQQADRLCVAAAARARTNVALVSKPTVLRGAGRLLREAAALHIPNVPWRVVNADAFMLDLVQKPDTVDVVATTSFLADVLSDLMAALCGGIGRAPSCALGQDVALFEPVHGTAPHLARWDSHASPVGAVRAAAMLLEHLGRHAAAERLWEATERADGPTLGVQRDQILDALSA